MKIKLTDQYKVTRGDQSLLKKKLLNIRNFEEFVEYSDNVSLVDFNTQD